MKEGQEGWEGGEGRGAGEEGRAGYNAAVGLSAAVAAVANIKPSLVLAARLHTSARGQALNRRLGNPKDATTVTALEEGTRLGWTVRATATPL